VFHGSDHEPPVHGFIGFPFFFFKEFLMVTQATLDVVQASGASTFYIVDADEWGGKTLEQVFANIQLSMAAAIRTGVTVCVQDIRKALEEQKVLAAMLQEARQLQTDAKSSGTSTTMPADMKAYMDNNGLAYGKAGNDVSMTEDEWEVAITSLQARVDSLGTDTQQKIRYLQGYIGRYDAHLQGARQSDHTFIVAQAR
jgi:hypothetical protein